MEIYTIVRQYIDAVTDDYRVFVDSTHTDFKKAYERLSKCYEADIAKMSLENNMELEKDVVNYEYTTSFDYNNFCYFVEIHSAYQPTYFINGKIVTTTIND